MERFRRYFGREVVVGRAKDAARLAEFGVRGRHVPDPPEEYDEFEFTTEFGGRDVLIMVTVAGGRIERILFTRIDPEDPELTRPLDPDALRDLLAARGDRLAEFFAYLTGRD
ncbi:MAG: hypothetical protein H5T97_04295 [Firmicutes bacterium]|nr:hypothetical protein [Bacillota bacterium]